MAERFRRFISGIKEHAGLSSYLYSPDRLAEIRKRLEGQKLVFIDANGVLCTLGSPIRANPKVNETVRSLKDLGYYLVLWTYAGRALLSIIEDLGIDLEPFSLSITGEDYRRRTPGDQKLFERAVGKCEWIRDEVKSNLLQGYEGMKTPALLTSRPFVFVQDYCDYLHKYQGVPRDWFVNVYPFGGGPIDNWKKLPVFGPNILQIIQERQVFKKNC